MLGRIQNLFRSKPAKSAPSTPLGERVYAVGDIHGRADLFGEIIQAIERDDAVRQPAATTIVLLGDLIDRGPHSSSVLAMAQSWQQRRKVQILAGNHEQVLLQSLLDLEAFSHFLNFGGRETILSYGVDPDALEAAGLSEAQSLMTAAIPAKDVAFVSAFEDYSLIGDYLFVHAGIYPGRSLIEQETRHLRWIREPFLSDRRVHEWFVIHGHTITTEADLQSNRLGLDTGAYASGRLTAVGLEETRMWLIQVEDADGRIRSSAVPIGLP